MCDWRGEEKIWGGSSQLIYMIVRDLVEMGRLSHLLLLILNPPQIFDGSTKGWISVVLIDETSPMDN